MTEPAASASIAAPAPPQPPRLSGDPQKDVVALNQWAFDFYSKTVLSGYFLNVQQQAESGDFDPGSLPDPASSTVAQAQQTANEAYAVAANAQADANRVDNWVTGTVQISGAATSGAVAFTTDQPDTSYKVMLSIAASTGTPASGAFVPVAPTSLAVGGFTANLQAAPGVGNSVTFNYFIVRNI